jgi:hypothetical protein
LCGNNRERHEKEGRKEEKIFFSEIFDFFGELDKWCPTL